MDEVRRPRSCRSDMSKRSRHDGVAGVKSSSHSLNQSLLGSHKETTAGVLAEIDRTDNWPAASTNDLHTQPISMRQSRKEEHQPLLLHQKQSPLTSTEIVPAQRSSTRGRDECGDIEMTPARLHIQGEAARVGPSQASLGIGDARDRRLTLCSAEGIGSAPADWLDRLGVAFFRVVILVVITFEVVYYRWCFNSSAGCSLFIPPILGFLVLRALCTCAPDGVRARAMPLWLLAEATAVGVQGLRDGVARILKKTKALPLFKESRSSDALQSWALSLSSDAQQKILAECEDLYDSQVSLRNAQPMRAAKIYLFGKPGTRLARDSADT